MTARAVIRQSNDYTGVKLAGQPMAFLVTGKNTKHTSMFDWTIPTRFSTGRHVHRVQEETFYVVEGECNWQIGEETVRAIHPAGSTAQHRQRNRQARTRNHDCLAARP